MSSLCEASLSLKQARSESKGRVSKHERKKKEKRRREREERHESRFAEERAASRASAPPQMAEGFLAWRDQQEIEGPDSWRIGVVVPSPDNSEAGNASDQRCAAGSSKGSRASKEAVTRCSRTARLDCALPETGQPGSDQQHLGQAGRRCSKRARHCFPTSIPSPTWGAGNVQGEPDSSKQVLHQVAHGAERKVLCIERTVVTLRVQAVIGEQERVLDITRWPFSIGRGTWCDLVIDDPKVSSEHCVLSLLPEGGCCEIQDMSLSGVRVNGVMLPRETAVPLMNSSMISLGKKGRHIFHLNVETLLKEPEFDDAIELDDVAELDDMASDDEQEEGVLETIELYTDDIIDEDEGEVSGSAAAAAADPVVEETMVEVAKRRRLLERLCEHEWLPQCGGDSCSLEELGHYNDLLTQSQRKRNFSPPAPCQGRHLRSKMIPVKIEVREEPTVAAPQIGQQTPTTAVSPINLQPKAWFQPLAVRAKATWGESLSGAEVRAKAWGVLPQTGVMNLGDAMDVVLQTLRRARHVCRLARTCKGMHRLVAGSTIWRFLYANICCAIDMRQTMKHFSFLRLDIPPDVWRKLYIDMVQYKQKRKRIKRGKAAALRDMVLQCPESECGMTFKYPHLLHAHLIGSIIRGSPHYTLAVDGMRHYCTQEFCPRYFSTAMLASRHANKMCAIKGSRQRGGRSLVRVMYGLGNFECSVCNASFRFQRAFDAHFITVNGGHRCPSSKEVKGAKVVAHEDESEHGEIDADDLSFDTNKIQHASELSLDMIKRFCHLSQTQAAIQLGVGKCGLQVRCRSLAFTWPEPKRLGWAGFKPVEQKLRSLMVEQVYQFAALHSWPSVRDPCKGVIRIDSKKKPSTWTAHVSYLRRRVILGVYRSALDAAIAVDVCHLANGTPQRTANGSYARPVKTDELNILFPLHEQAESVEVPAELLEIARKLVDAHKHDHANARLNDSSITIVWRYDLEKAAFSKELKVAAPPRASTASKRVSRPCKSTPPEED